MLAVFVVRNLMDTEMGTPIPGSLRRAVELANAADGADQIIFHDDAFQYVNGQPTLTAIALNAGQIDITDEVEILGPGPGQLTVQAQPGNNRIFNTNIGADDEFFNVEISGMTLSGGNLVGTGSRGGAVFNRESLTMVETVITGNSAPGGGGGVFTEIGSLTLQRSLVQGNSGAVGGGILNGFDVGADMPPSTTIINSTLTGNTATGAPDIPADGGAAANRNGSLSIQHSTIIGNSAGSGGGVATYGAEFDPEQLDDFVSIPTSLTHTIAFNNQGGDLFGRIQALDGDEFILPTLEIDSFNFIGAITNTEFWDPEDGGNSSFYQIVNVGDDVDLSWGAADFIAQQMGGHLGTLTSQEENDFVATLLTGADWMNYEPELDLDPEPDPPIEYSSGPWLGGMQDPIDGAPDEGWEWVTGEEWDYTNWGAMEPDDGTANMGAMIFESFLSFHDTTGAMMPTWGDRENLPEEDDAVPTSLTLEYTQVTDFHNVDPLLSNLGNFGGPTPVFYPSSESTPGPVSPVIDAGNPEANLPPFEQRGRQFTRMYGAAVDIGAVEVQNGNFVVDALVDETDGQYSGVWENTGTEAVPVFQILGYEVLGDFALREALEFSEANPEFDTVFFSPTLQDLPDLTPSNPPTIYLTIRSPQDQRSALTIRTPLDIQGPTDFELEIDASGGDPTLELNNGDGMRVFRVDDGNLMNDISVRISDLTMMGGDVNGNGGGIFSLEDLTVVDSTFRQNASSADGGGVFTQVGNLIIDGATFHNNLAADEGGAVFFDSGLPGTVLSGEIISSTISGNRSGNRGGGVANRNAEVSIRYSTITQNEASSTRGSGVASLNGADALTEIGSSIISNNSDNDVEFLSGATNITSLGFNLIGNGNAAVVFNQPGDMTGVLDPMLAPLANNGGLTPTHRLLPGSPAIDAGDPVAVAGMNGVPAFDQRGAPYVRVFDGVFDEKDRIDIGAFELQASTFVVDTLIDENDGFISPGNFSLREAIEQSNSNPLPDTIMFDPALLGGTIFQNPANSGILKPGTPTDMRITDSVDIIGLGEPFLTLDGSGALTDALFVPPVGEPIPRSRFFTIDDGDANNRIEVSISDLSFTNSSNTTQVGGSIRSSEDLTVARVTMFANATYGPGMHGGALYQRDGTLLLDGVTISGNETRGVDADGGGVYAVDADVTFMNSTSIAGNSTTESLGSGGGAYVSGGSLAVVESSITGNLAPAGDADGAGLFVANSDVELTDAVVSGNSMTGSNSEGAGIFSQNSALNMTRTVVTNNFTTGTQSEGAAFYMNGGEASIDEGIITGNFTTGTGSEGGAIYVNGGSLDINATSVSTNRTTGANSSGGAIVNAGGELLIRSSTVAGNMASGNQANGGGVYSDTDLLGASLTTVLNSTVSGNSAAARGGGVFNAGGGVEILHSTVAKNTVPSNNSGAGVASLGTPGSAETRIGSSLIVGNRATGPGVTDDLDSVSGDFQNSIVSLGYNVVGSGNSASAFTSTGDVAGANDSLLGPLGHNGGPTQTHELLEGSPAINAGDPAFDPTDFSPNLNFDQRGVGFSRVNQGRIDVGAAESNFIVVGPADFNENGFTDGFDFLMWQRGFGKTSGAAKSDGDANSDGAVNDVDLNIWESTFGTEGAVESAGVASDDAATQTSLAAATSSFETEVAAGDVDEAPSAAYFVTADDAQATTGRDRNFRPASRDRWLAEQLLTARDQGIDRWAGDRRHVAPALGEGASLDVAEAGQERADAEDAVFDQLGAEIGRFGR